MSGRRLESFSKAVLVRFIRKRIYHYKVEDLLRIEKELEMDKAMDVMDDATKRMAGLLATDPEYWVQQERFNKAGKRFDRLVKVES